MFELLQRIENEQDLLNLMITCDETWVRGLIQKFQDWCRHLHSSGVSAKQRYMVEQACLASLHAKFHVGGMKWADFTRVYLESCT